MITILAIGKKHEDWVLPGLDRYQKRMRSPFDIRWELLPHSTLNHTDARNEESLRILSRLKTDDYVILLDETGTQLSSPALSQRLDKLFVGSSRVVLVIGGAYGVSEMLRSRATFCLSLSDMVFPHQLVRLILIEQLYRAQEIRSGKSYHHS